MNLEKEQTKEIILKRAYASDCKDLYDIQIKSFHDLLEKYQDEENPGAEEITYMEGKFQDPCFEFYFIALSGTGNIGGFIIRNYGKVVILNRINILPEFQGYGYAQEAMRQVELLYPQAERWELDTIKQEDKLCHLYEKQGYVATGESEHIQDGMDIVYYYKNL